MVAAAYHAQNAPLTSRTSRSNFHLPYPFAHHVTRYKRFVPTSRIRLRVHLSIQTAFVTLSKISRFAEIFHTFFMAPVDSAPPARRTCVGRAGRHKVFLRRQPARYCGQHCDPRHCRFSKTHTSNSQEATNMDYLLLIYEDEKRFATQKEDDFKTEMADYMNFGKEHAGIIKGGN